MTTHWSTSLTRLTDQALLARVHDLARRERRAIVALIAHLAELDERRLYLDEGCSSLFTYCTEVLHYSEHAAYNRIECARAARRFPEVLDRLADGSVHLTAVRLLAPHLTPTNHVELLDRARHMGKRGVEELVASIRPLPDVATVVRRLPVTRRAADSSTARSTHATGISLFEDADHQPSVSRLESGAASPYPASPSGASAAPASPVPPPVPPPAVAPLAPGRFRVQFTADQEMNDDLRTARELLRHQVPNGDAATIMKMALKLLVTDLHRRKFARTDRPRRSTPPRTHSRLIPAAVRREVSSRDGDQCAFRARDGRRCSARGLLEFHHLEPFAVGGPATVENITLRCRAHNAHEAVRSFGPRQLVPERVGRPGNPVGLSGPR